MPVPGGMGRLLACCVLAGICAGQEGARQEEGVATFGTTVVIPSGLRGLVYLLPPGTSWLPQFERLKPAGVIYTTKLEVIPQEWTFGFPGVTNRFEWFALDYTGRFWVQQPGEYEFALTSDDGSNLYIDDRLLIYNDGMHPPVTEKRTIQLGCGIHHLRVSYFQGPRTQVALVLMVKGGGKKWRPFSTEEFKPPPNPADWQCDSVAALSPAASGRRLLRDNVLSERPHEAAAAAALQAALPPRDFVFHAAAYLFRNDGAGQQGALAFEIPGASLAATRVPADGTNRVHISLLARVKRDDGQLIDKFSVDAPYQVPDANLAAVRASAISFSHPTSLPLGRYSVEVAVVDHEASKSSVLTLPLEVARPRQGVTLSSIVLVQRVEPVSGTPNRDDPLIDQGKRAIPLLSGKVEPGQQASAYFVIYPDRASTAPPRLRVEVLLNGQAAGEQTVDLPPVNAAGAIPMIVALPAQPGRCELRITALQGGDSVTRSASLEVAGAR